MTESFLLGTGSMGTCVYVAIMDDGSEVAVKRMLIQTCKVAAENEKAILTLINTQRSPFIVSYRHFVRDNIFMYLIVDLCEETLADHVLFQSAKHVQEHGRRMIKEILTGLEFLHAQGILHRDLKPSNVLVDVEGHMRLADFGISRVLNEDETTVQTDAKGTQGWMSSEVIKTGNKGGKCRYKKKSDVQVAGMITYFILNKGEHPFGSVHDRMTNILRGNPVNLEKLDDPDARQFISKLIRHKIEDRPHACEALRHPFMNEKTKCEWKSKPCDRKKDGINPDKHCTSGDAEHNFQQSSDEDETDFSQDVMYGYEDNDPDDDEHSSSDDENDDTDIVICDASDDFEDNDPDDDEHSSTDDENDDTDIVICDASDDFEDNDPDDDEHSSVDLLGDHEDNDPDDDEHSSADDENDGFDIDEDAPSGDHEDNNSDDDEHSSTDDDDENDSFNDDMMDL
ncbi:serine threonine- kinase ppk4-like [Paramuricea clavata]|uniref:Serine threonine- kinase ppk4-like n=1 Tax=Paramuricea clavata TaxID=317549 RepID=A0A7D9I0P7_PARCT|nr:serine threonine- kinase ppk4-like [Paramuricea clavata]